MVEPEGQQGWKPQGKVPGWVRVPGQPEKRQVGGRQGLNQAGRHVGRLKIQCKKVQYKSYPLLFSFFFLLLLLNQAHRH